MKQRRVSTLSEMDKRIDERRLTKERNSLSLNSNALQIQLKEKNETIEELNYKLFEVNEHLELAEARIQELHSKLLQEQELRRQCLNQLQELKGNIRVFCRSRPLQKNESESVVEFVDENRLVLKNKSFEFDRVFDPTTNQATIFQEIQPLILSVLDGYNVCIFAYGQTGSGKTYTMEGPPNDRGVNFLAIQHLFKFAEQTSVSHKYSFRISILEIYNEQIRDLLTNNSKKLDVRLGSQGTYVPDLTELEVHSPQNAWQLMQVGVSNRVVSETQSNEHSSRSHCLVIFSVTGENISSGAITKAKLWLIDLAGSV